jgi:hypothetical protein
MSKMFDMTMPVTRENRWLELIDAEYKVKNIAATLTLLCSAPLRAFDWHALDTRRGALVVTLVIVWPICGLSCGYAMQCCRAAKVP